MTEKKSIGMAGEVLTTAELVSYQPGAVVSRTLVNKKGSTVTLFAFDEGQELSEHAPPFDALVEVIDGETVITIAGKEHPLRAGQMIIMPANDPHAVRAVTQMKMMLVMSRD